MELYCILFIEAWLKNLTTILIADIWNYELRVYYSLVFVVFNVRDEIESCLSEYVVKNIIFQTQNSMKNCPIGSYLQNTCTNYDAKMIKQI